MPANVDTDTSLQEIRRLFEAGRYQPCLEQCSETLSHLAKDNDDRRGQILLWKARAQEPTQGRKEALVTLKKTLTLAQDKGVRLVEAEALIWIVKFTAGGDDFAERKRMLEDAEKLAQGTPQPKRISALADAEWPRIRAGLNETPDSLSYINAAIDTWRKLDDEFELARAMISRAQFFRQENNLNEAQRQLCSVVNIAHTKGFAAVNASAHSWLGMLEKTRGDEQKATHHFKAAEELYLKIDLPSWAENVRAFWDPITQKRRRYRWAD